MQNTHQPALCLIDRNDSTSVAWAIEAWRKRGISPYLLFFIQLSLWSGFWGQAHHFNEGTDTHLQTACSGARARASGRGAAFAARKSGDRAGLHSDCQKT